VSLSNAFFPSHTHIDKTKLLHGELQYYNFYLEGTITTEVKKRKNNSNANDDNATAESKQEEEKEIIIYVKDTGIGIDPEILSR
jgi:signal transduction histidine kinase